MTHASFNIENNRDFEPLSKLLAGVRRAGEFFVSGAAEIPMPKVEVDGVGPLSFPVPPGQIAATRSSCDDVTNEAFNAARSPE